MQYTWLIKVISRWLRCSYLGDFTQHAAALEAGAAVLGDAAFPAKARNLEKPLS